MIRTRLATLAGLVLCATLLGCSGGSDNPSNANGNDGATTNEPQTTTITPIAPPGSNLGAPNSGAGAKSH